MGKKKIIIGTIAVVFMVIVAFIVIVAINVKSQSTKVDNETNREIMVMINEGNFEEAAVRLKEVYGNIDYSDPDGYGKMALYWDYYEGQGMYDDAMEVCLEYLEKSGYLGRIGNFNDMNDELGFRDCVRRLNTYWEEFGDENKEQAINLLGVDVLEEYDSLEIDVEKYLD